MLVTCVTYELVVPLVPPETRESLIMIVTASTYEPSDALVPMATCESIDELVTVLCTNRYIGL